MRLTKYQKLGYCYLIDIKVGYLKCPNNSIRKIIITLNFRAENVFLTYCYTTYRTIALRIKENPNKSNLFAVF